MQEASAAATSEVASTESQVAEVSADSDNKGAVAQETESGSAPEKKSYKVKVDGQELDVTEEALVKEYELKQASYKRMQEAARKERELQAIYEQIEADPIKFLESKNKNAREAAEKYLAKVLQAEMMSPEEREQQKVKEELEKYKSEEKKRAEKEEAARIAQEEQKEAARLDDEISTALEQSQLAKTPYTIKRIAHKMYTNIKAGIDISAKDAIEMVQEEDFNDIKVSAKDLSGEQLIKLLGDDLVSKIRKAELGRLKSNPTSARPKQAASTSSPSKTVSKMSMDEFQEYLKNKRN